MNPTPLHAVTIRPTRGREAILDPRNVPVSIARVGTWTMLGALALLLAVPVIDGYNPAWIHQPAARSPHASRVDGDPAPLVQRPTRRAGSEPAPRPAHAAARKPTRRLTPLRAQAARRPVTPDRRANSTVAPPATRVQTPTTPTRTPQRPSSPTPQSPTPIAPVPTPPAPKPPAPTPPAPTTPQPPRPVTPVAPATPAPDPSTSSNHNCDAVNESC